MSLGALGFGLKYTVKRILGDGSCFLTVSTI